MNMWGEIDLGDGPDVYFRSDIRAVLAAIDEANTSPSDDWDRALRAIGTAFKLQYVPRSQRQPRFREA